MIASSLSRWFGRLALCGLLALGGCGAQIELFSNIAERDVKRDLDRQLKIRNR